MIKAVIDILRYHQKGRETMSSISSKKEADAHIDRLVTEFSNWVQHVKAVETETVKSEQNIETFYRLLVARILLTGKPTVETFEKLGAAENELQDEIREQNEIDDGITHEDDDDTEDLEDTEDK